MRLVLNTGRAVIIMRKTMRQPRLLCCAMLVVALIIYTPRCNVSLNKNNAFRMVLSHLPTMTVEALREGIASGTFHNTCLSNLPTLAGMSLEWYRTTLPKHTFCHITDSHLDPVSGKPFGYSPVTPAGLALCLVTNTFDELMAMQRDQRWEEMFGRRAINRERPYFWLWQPDKDNQGYRFFITTDRDTYSKTDDRVSWYYQTFIEYLTPDELEQERRYSASRPHVP